VGSTQAEALGFLRAALAARPGSTELMNAIGACLTDDLNRPGEGEEVFRDVIRLRPDHARARANLVVALRMQGKAEEAVTAAREAVAVAPRISTYFELGQALRAAGRQESAEAFRAAIRFEPRTTWDYRFRARSLQALGRTDEAIAAYREGTRVNPFVILIRIELANMLFEQGRLEEAAAEIREGIRHQPGFPPAHYTLGKILVELERWDEATDAYREAIRLEPAYAEAHINLGLIYIRKGRYAEALASYTRGHQLGSRRVQWPYPTAERVEWIRRLVALEPRLPALLDGTDPDNAADAIAVAILASQQARYVRAAELYRVAFQLSPAAADDIRLLHRYNAACAAARSGCGQGEGAARLDDAAQAAWREQALKWLRVELVAREKQLTATTPAERREVEARLGHWFRDRDLAGVRDAAGLAKLPHAERAEWQKFWSDVRAARDRARVALKKK
jgi:tetratricopeptide (TPR) repeat protein